MTAPANLTRRVLAGETIKPWIMLGPFNQDMSDMVVECGRQDDRGSFHSFVKVLSSASIGADGLHGAIAYESPSIGRFDTGWEVKPTANDMPVELSRYPLVDSAWAHSDLGSREMVLRHGDEVYELWFNQ